MQNILNKIIPFIKKSGPLQGQLENIDLSNSFICLNINEKKVLQVSTPHQQDLQFVQQDEDRPIVSAFKGSRLTLQSDSSEDVDAFLNYLPHVYASALENGKKILLKEAKVITDMNSEQRGHEWIKTSMVVLKSAIEKCQQDDELLYEGTFFSGKRTGEEPWQIRIHSLSLDFLLLFLDDGRLQVKCWNHKNKLPNSTLPPTFQGEFYQLKQPVFDEFIKLIVEISKISTKY